MSAKLFTVAGASKLAANEPLKLRVATGSAKGRANVMTSNGHVDVQMFDLPKAMDKEAARTWLIAKGIAISGMVAVDKDAKKAVKATATKVKAKVAAAKTAPAAKVEAAPAGASEAALAPEAKLALKRARDAARKRLKRAEAKAQAAA